MKKLMLLTLAIGLFACEAQAPDPVVESELVELEVEDIGRADKTTNLLETEEQVFLVVEKAPEFAGGMDAWNNFLKNNLKYPEQAQRMGVEGRVFISFVVMPDGEIVDPQLIRGIGAGCDEEALRVINESPAWNPGEQRGVKVPTRMQLAMTFKLK